jgi:hypothetical protein
MSTMNRGNVSDAPGFDAHKPAPVLLDLGQQKPKAIRQLRKGRGKLVEEVMAAIDELKTTGAIATSAQPVIVIVREKTESLFPGLDI